MLKKKIISNTTINFAGRGLTYAIQLAIIAYLVKVIGKEAYGIIVLALGLIGNANLFESGFGLSVTKYIAEYKVKDDWEKINTFINTNLFLILIQATIFVVILFILSHFLLFKLFNVPQNFHVLAVEVLDIFIATAFIDFIWAGFFRVAEGFQWYKLIRTMGVVREAIRAVLIFGLLSVQPSMTNVGIAYLISSVISCIVLYHAILFKDNRIKIKTSYVNRETFKQMFSFSLKIFIAKIYAFISYKIDIFVIGFFLSTTALTYYQIAYKYYELVKYIFPLITSTIVPVTSELGAIGAKDKLRYLFETATKYTVIIGFPVIIISYFLSGRLIGFWVGPEFTESIALSKIFLFSLLPRVLTVCGSEMLIGLDRFAHIIKYTGIGAIVNLIISLILVRMIGTAGVVWGTITGSFIAATGYISYMLKYFEITIKEFLNTVLLKPAILAILLCLMIKLLPNIGGIFVCLTAYLSSAYVYLLDTSDKELFKSYFKSIQQR